MISWVRKICWRKDRLATPVFLGFSGGSDGKESACSEGDLGLILGSGRSPGGEHGNPLQYSCLENPRGRRSLAGYSPWGRKESDTTERLHFHIQSFALIGSYGGGLGPGPAWKGRAAPPRGASSIPGHREREAAPTPVSPLVGAAPRETRGEAGADEIAGRR